MNLEQLRYIVEVSKTGSISEAAKTMHISQPNVSQSILNLEKELNIKIFDRSRVGVTPTKIGDVFIDKSIMILNQINELKKYASIESEILQGSLKVIAIPIIGLTFLPETLKIFKEKYPGVQLEVVENGSNYGITNVAEDMADLAIISQRSNKNNDFSNLHFEPLVTSKTIAYVGKDSPLAHRKEVSLKDIINYPLVLFNQSYSSHDFIQNALEKFGTPNILFTSGNSDTMRKVIAESLAIGFYSEVSLKTDPYIQNKQIVPIRIKEEENIYSTYGIVSKRKDKISIETKKFIKEIKIQAKYYKMKNQLPDYSLLS